MLKFRDFKCQVCGAWSERMVKDEVKEIECLKCAGVASRMLSAPKCGNNTTGGSPSYSSFKW